MIVLIVLCALIVVLYILNASLKMQLLQNCDKFSFYGSTCSKCSDEQCLERGGEITCPSGRMQIYSVLKNKCIDCADEFHPGTLLCNHNGATFCQKGLFR